MSISVKPHSKKKSMLVKPVVKWVGGKRQLLPEIDKLKPKTGTWNKYYEPFIGGGALLFHLQPKSAIINDFNEELINIYKVIKSSPEELITHLGTHENEEDYFYSLRGLDRNQDVYDSLSNIEKASRIIYLNKTCFNGLFRVNSSGEFNAPYGRYEKPNIQNKYTIRAVSKYFNDNEIEIKSGDYEKVLEKVDSNSFVYFDPPYDPVSDSSNFTGYTKNGFGRDEQKRLKLICDKLHKKGTKFLLSNSSTEFIQELYKNPDYKIHFVKAKRAISSKGDGRGPIFEILIRNYD